MKKYYNLFLLSFACCFIACSDDDKTAGPTDWPTLPGSDVSGISQTYAIGNTLSTEKIALVWADEFATDGLVNTENWTYEKGHVRNQEVQYYTEARKENCRIENGQLIITGRKETTAYPGATPIDGVTYTSASIITNKKKSWQFGRFEIKAKVPSGSTGIWPAFWAKGDSQNSGKGWPQCGEIDIMEYAAKNPNEMIHNIIWGKSSTEKANIVLKPTLSKPYSDDYHVYSLNWSSTQVCWAIDNVVTQVVNMSEIDAKGYENPFHQSFSILLNLALGTPTDGSLGGKFDPAVMATDKEFIVDYVRVYQTATE